MHFTIVYIIALLLCQQADIYGSGRGRAPFSASLESWQLMDRLQRQEEEEQKKQRDREQEDLLHPLDESRKTQKEAQEAQETLNTQRALLHSLSHQRQVPETPETSRKSRDGLDQQLKEIPQPPSRTLSSVSEEKSTNSCDAQAVDLRDNDLKKQQENRTTQQNQQQMLSQTHRLPETASYGCRLPQQPTKEDLLRITIELQEKLKEYRTRRSTYGLLTDEVMGIGQEICADYSYLIKEYQTYPELPDLRNNILNMRSRVRPVQQYVDFYPNWIPGDTFHPKILPVTEPQTATVTKAFIEAFLSLFNHPRC